jgi:hypothetical protein
MWSKINHYCLGAVAFSKVNVIEYDVTWAAVNKDYLLDEWISATGDAEIAECIINMDFAKSKNSNEHCKANEG